MIKCSLLWHQVFLSRIPISRDSYHYASRPSSYSDSGVAFQPWSNTTRVAELKGSTPKEAGSAEWTPALAPS